MGYPMTTASFQGLRAIGAGVPGFALRLIFPLILKQISAVDSASEPSIIPVSIVLSNFPSSEDILETGSVFGVPREAMEAAVRWFMCRTHVMTSQAVEEGGPLVGCDVVEGENQTSMG